MVLFVATWVRFCLADLGYCGFWILRFSTFLELVVLFVQEGLVVFAVVALMMVLYFVNELPCCGFFLQT